MTTTRRIALAAVLLACPAAALAHHSYAMFDQTRKLTVQGTIRSLEWTNPHIWVWVDVADVTGGTTPYGFESNAPSELSRFFGWTRRSLAAGDKVTVDYSPLRSGRNGGALRLITVVDGRVLRTPRSDPNYITGPRGAAGPNGDSEVK